MEETFEKRQLERDFLVWLLLELLRVWLNGSMKKDYADTFFSCFTFTVHQEGLQPLSLSTHPTFIHRLLSFIISGIKQNNYGKGKGIPDIWPATLNLDRMKQVPSETLSLF